MPTTLLSILLVEDSRAEAVLVRKAIAEAFPGEHTLEHASTLAQAQKLLSAQTFDVVLLDRSLPDVDGFSGLDAIQTQTPRVPIIFVTGYKDEQTALEAIERGAQDYIYKDRLDAFSIGRAVRYAIQRKHMESALLFQTHYDTLTGVANRKLFESRLEQAMARLDRKGGMIGLLFLDLNGFKKVNDTYGHSTADILLQQIAQRFQKLLRPYDLLARLGGDEFVVLVDDAVNIQSCEAVAKKLIESSEKPFMIDTHEILVGVSIGITATKDTAVPINDFISAADSAMYEAKRRKEGSAYHIAS